MSRTRLGVLVLFAVALVAFFAAGGPRYFTFENLKAQQAAREAGRALYPGQTALGFFAMYVAYTSLSLPAARPRRLRAVRLLDADPDVNRPGQEGPVSAP